MYLNSTFLNARDASIFPGLANRTAEKVKPSALDLLLLFKETVRLKQSVPGVKKSSIRDVLYACIADYNKTVSNHRAPWHKHSIIIFMSMFNKKKLEFG